MENLFEKRVVFGFGNVEPSSAAEAEGRDKAVNVLSGFLPDSLQNLFDSGDKEPEAASDKDFLDEVYDTVSSWIGGQSAQAAELAGKKAGEANATLRNADPGSAPSPAAADLFRGYSDNVSTTTRTVKAQLREATREVESSGGKTVTFDQPTSLEFSMEADGSPSGTETTNSLPNAIVVNKGESTTLLRVPGKGYARVQNSSISSIK